MHAGPLILFFMLSFPFHAALDLEKREPFPGLCFSFVRWVLWRGLAWQPLGAESCWLEHGFWASSCTRTPPSVTLASIPHPWPSGIVSWGSKVRLCVHQAALLLAVWWSIFWCWRPCSGSRVEAGFSFHTDLSSKKACCLSSVSQFSQAALTCPACCYRCHICCSNLKIWGTFTGESCFLCLEYRSLSFLSLMCNFLEEYSDHKMYFFPCSLYSFWR